MKRIKILLFLICFLLIGTNPISGATVDSNGTVLITNNDIKQAYDQYLSSYQSGPIKSLSSLSKLSGLSDSNYQLTPFGKEVALNYLNFIRAIHGIGSVQLNDQYSYYSQAGVDFLRENNLEIDHYAADKTNNVDAQTGLHNSNLSNVSNIIDHLSGCFDDFNNVGGYNTGHRDHLLDPQVGKVGFATTRGYSATFILDESVRTKRPVVSYPAAGVSPFELINSSSIPLWSINFGDYYQTNRDLTQMKVNVTDDLGKSVDLNPGLGLKGFDKDVFFWGRFDNSLQLQPDSLFNGDYRKSIGRTYTITISGLRDGKTYTYQTTIASLNKIASDSSYIPVRELHLNQNEIEVEVGNLTRISNIVKIIPENATIKSLEYEVDDTNIVDLLSYSDNQIIVNCLKLGTTQLHIRHEDGPEATCILKVVEKGTSVDKPTESDFTIKTNVNPSNAGSVSGAGNFKLGDRVKLSVKPNNGYEFVNWTDNGNVVCEFPDYTFIANKSTTITANFEKKSEDSNNKPNNPTQSDEPSKPNNSTNGIEIYRLYNPVSTEHLYTPSSDEVKALTQSGWNNEGVGWKAPNSGTAVYRLYNPILADHLYTSDQNEVNVLTQQQGWVADFGGQPIFYSSSAGTPIYRLYNDINKRHLLTKDQNEFNTLPQYNWKQEGISLYGLQ